MKFNHTIIITILTILAVGCSSTADKNKLVNKQRGAYDDLDASTSGLAGDDDLSGTELEGNLTGHPLGREFDDPMNPLSKRVIYFNYDSSEVRSEFIEVIQAHADYLVAHPDQKITLEGHADERGSREYNIALGEIRAKSVSRMMEMHGVFGSQIAIISYGEEKPDSNDHSEEGWGLNRRVEVQYQGI